MSVTINGRSWSISDFIDKAHTQPKSPDSSGTPAFPDGIFNDFFVDASVILASAVSQRTLASGFASLASAAMLAAQALTGSVPALSSATHNAILAPNNTGNSYNLLQWTVITSAHGSTLSAGSWRLMFDTSGGPFTITMQGTPSEFAIVEVADYNRTFYAKNATLIFNGTIAGSGYSGPTVIFDVTGDHAMFQFISNKWRAIQ